MALSFQTIFEAPLLCDKTELGALLSLFFWENDATYRDHAGFKKETLLGSRLIILDPQPDRRQFNHRQEVA